MDGKHVKSVRHSRTSLPRRFFICSPGSPNTGITNEARYFSPPKSLLGLKLEKVDWESYTRDRVLRHHLEYVCKQKESTETEMRSVVKRSVKTSKWPMELDSRHVIDSESKVERDR